MIRAKESVLRRVIRSEVKKIISDLGTPVSEAGFLRKVFGMGPKMSEKRPFKSSNWSPEFMASHRKQHPDFPEGWMALPNEIHDNGWKGLLKSMTPDEQDQFMFMSPNEQDRVAQERGYRSSESKNISNDPYDDDPYGDGFEDDDDFDDDFPNKI